MEESRTYQLIVARGRKEGRLAEARSCLLRLGPVKFGCPADKVITRTVESITDLDRLDALLERLLSVSSWDELLAAP